MVKKGELNVQRRKVLNGRINPYVKIDRKAFGRKVVSSNLNGIFSVKIIGDKDESQNKVKKSKKDKTD